MTAPTLGQQLDEIGRRLDVTTAAWVAAGYPDEGPTVDAREAVFADLRAWNQRATPHADVPPGARRRAVAEYVTARRDPDSSGV